VRSRAFHRTYARTMGYFWLPCPLCGQEFGGHEWRDIDGKRSSIPAPDGPQGMSIGICPDCTEAGRGYDDPIFLAVGREAVERFFDEHPEFRPRED
jgi:hypothetical protein